MERREIINLISTVFFILMCVLAIVLEAKGTFQKVYVMHETCGNLSSLVTTNRENFEKEYKVKLESLNSNKEINFNFSQYNE